jgi:DNA polymerase-3 subunit gamma/tau
MLELICGRILLPIGDSGESGMLSRIERLERAENIAPMTTPAPAKAVEKKEAPAAPVKAEAVPAEVKVDAPAAKVTSAPGAFDIAALRRAWPDVIEDVKKRRRLTWSLLSASAQVLAVDDSKSFLAKSACQVGWREKLVERPSPFQRSDRLLS